MNSPSPATRLLSSASFLLLAISSLKAAPTSLFDGVSLEGWEYNAKMWRVENGTITGGSTTKKVSHNDFISTKGNYQNFELKLKIKCSGDPKTGMINSGIQIRSARIPNDPHLCGYQIDCGKGWFGKIYDEFRRRKVIAEPLDAAGLAKAVDIYGWNEYRIRAEGPRIQVWINDVAATDHTETNPDIALDGHIGIQVHGGGMCLVEFKDITIEELPPTEDAPTWKSLGGVESARKLAAPPKNPKAKPAPAPAPKKRGRKDISYNDVQGSAKSAAEQLKLFHLPEGYEIELVVQESEGLGKFVSVYFDQRGRLWTQTALEYPVDANENRASAAALYKTKARDKILVFPREGLNNPLPPEGLTNPTVFADGLAIPLGILPWGKGDSCYAIHGPDLVHLTDTDGDGISDKREVVLTGFGIEDSHLFPHQFTRAPGGWIWMAQGLFNYSKVKMPGTKDGEVPWPKCSMARLRPDGSGFEVTTVGPNNIWGLVINGLGETFIQEANDFGYPVMPYHEYAYYPGGMAGLRKSYQPEFPPAAEFRMGGTGLSGLALLEKGPRQVIKADQTMLVANPITSKIQALAMHRDGPYWKLAQMPDFITCDDPFFRPVGMTQGPDGAIYIVDWYNKIISHNEVPRNHPDRDKTRGRIWRVRPIHGNLPGTAPPGERPGSIRFGLPDFTELSNEELIAMLGERPTARAHFAWQTLADRDGDSITQLLRKRLSESNVPDAVQIQALWILHEDRDWDNFAFMELGNRNVRRELVNYGIISPFSDDHDPEVRAAAIRIAGKSLGDADPKLAPTLLYSLLEMFAKPSIDDGPTAQSSRGSGLIPTREVYDREFERFLIRFLLEKHPDMVAMLLDSDAAAELDTEARILAALALEPKTSASRIATLLPKLDRAPNAEELLRIAQFANEPGCGEALESLLAKPESRALVATQLLQQKTKLDPKGIAPFLTKAAEAMLDGEHSGTAVELIGAFQLKGLESVLAKRARSSSDPAEVLPSLRALRQLRSTATDLFVTLARDSKDVQVRDEALAALAGSPAPDAGERLFALYPVLDSAQRRKALNALSSSKTGAKTLVAALLGDQIPKTDLDGPTAERLSAVLGKDKDLATLMNSLGHVFRDVLLLDGSPSASADPGLTLDGPFTVETWVRLAPEIHNQDGILWSKNALDMNFFGSTFRVWAGSGLGDVARSTKPMAPDFWTHLAVTRDASGTIKIYTNGELDVVGSKKAPGKFSNLKIGHTNPKEGTRGALAEYRIWDRERSDSEIRATFDRSFATTSPKPDGLIFYNPGGDKSWGKLGRGARIAKTIDLPPVLTTAQAEELDTKFNHYMELGRKGGNVENGKLFSAVCLGCHIVNGAGGKIGPELSGAGAMGLEGVLRNILTPNAAMEAGYRIYRVELKNGDLIDAFYVSEDKQAVVVRQLGIPDRRIPKKEIRSTRYIRRSLMPEGLLDPYNDEQISDILAYLMTLK